MARSINLAVHAVRRDAVVEAAQRLIASDGYEQSRRGFVASLTPVSTTTVRPGVEEGASA